MINDKLKLLVILAMAVFTLSLIYLKDVKVSKWPSYMTHVGKFGAHPNDGKPDNLGFQKAIDDVSIHGGGRVVMGSGNYDMQESVLLDDDIELRGR